MNECEDLASVPIIDGDFSNPFCVCVFVCIPLCVCTRVHACVSLYVFMCTLVCVSLCICMYSGVGICVFMYSVCMSLCECVCVCILNSERQEFCLTCLLSLPFTMVDISNTQLVHTEVPK